MGFMRWGGAVGETFELPLKVTIRPGTRDDLFNLEWYGLYTPHRDIICEAYERQEGGKGLMLLAVLRGFPIGQVWLDLASKAAEGVAVLWAFRVYPFLQGLGIGTRLLNAAEQVPGERGLSWVEVAVEKDNPGVRRLYERRGYRAVGEEQGEFSYTTPWGNFVRQPVEAWTFRKQLVTAGPHARPPGEFEGDRREG